MSLVCPKCARSLNFSGEAPSYCPYCGAPLRGSVLPATGSDAPTVAPAAAANDDRHVPQVIGGYRLGRKLGAGGMGSVYEAEDVKSGRRVALKLIAPEYAGSPEAVERFRQEGRLASMVAHPRCVFVIAVDEDAGRPYIVMELMSGETLQDLVQRQGPLPVDQALAKILDVIDGLQAAHRLEVIHRDVKPSNCFLEADGRVKVGDFGLAKSLVQDGRLTKTGSFIGTPFFASPEQIRAEPVDSRTDIYSVSATFFYLLTGKAPFQGSDPGATLARIVSEDAPSVRRLRPDVPHDLDRILRRGLERDLDKRWPDFDSLRDALVSIVPEPLTWDGIRRRIAAGVLDAIIVLLVAWLVGWIGLRLFLPTAMTRQEEVRQVLLGHALTLLIAVAYFSLLDSLRPGTPGKALCRLLVRAADRDDPPLAGIALLRAAIFCGLLGLGPVVANLILLSRAGEDLVYPEWNALQARVGWLLPLAWFVAGWVMLFSTARAASGFRGLHEWASGTRVVQLPLLRHRQRLATTGPWLFYFLTTRRLDQQLPQRQSFPERVGGFAIRGVLRWTAEDKILLGEDASLGRRAFLWLRPRSFPPLDQARREVGRRTRLRWLGCGLQGEFQWDALLAPLGCPVTELVRTEGTMSWADAKPVLLEMVNELAAACREATVPRTLSPAMVWVQSEGRVQLADTALVDTVGDAVSAAASDFERSLILLRDLATLTLLGRASASAEDMAQAKAALEPGGRGFLERLFAAGPAFFTLDELCAELTAK
jgi:eukaryotic-like serine/threonine-protein kinase